MELAQSALGFVGAETIHQELLQRGRREVPSVRTIGRVLVEEELLQRVHRVRQAPPPAGWYLPRLASRAADLDSCDYVEDLRLEGGPLLQVFTTRAVWAPAAGAWVCGQQSAAATCQHLLSHWRRHGTPHYAQFDNGTVFQGGHNWPDTFGLVTRFCLALGVTPVFAPAAEHGAQNLIEHFNGLWEQKVWLRFCHDCERDLQRTSDRFIAALCDRRARSERRAPRTPLAPAGQLDLRKLAPGTIIYLRRSNDAGVVRVLGHDLALPPTWAHRLVRVEVDLNASLIWCYGLRRSEPFVQPLLFQQAYVPKPRRTFQAELTSIIWH
jgi:hypothetical protein